MLKQASTVTWATVNASSSTSYSIPDNSNVSILVTSGTVTMNLSGNNGNGIVLSSGQSVEFSTVNAQTLTLSGGIVNIQVQEF